MQLSVASVQLAASQEGLSSMGLVKICNFVICIDYTKQLRYKFSLKFNICVLETFSRQ
jgi:hypothetical protein